MILAVVGMKREARLLARVGVRTIVGGGNAGRLATEIEAVLTAGPLERWSGLLSFGVAGALDPSLKAGDVVVASGVWTSRTSLDSPGRPTPTLPVDPAWAGRLLESIAGARSGLIIGQDTPAASVEDKSALYAATCALAVDMESHIAGAAAACHGLPFAALRAISDRADDTLPPAAIAGFGVDGGVDLAAVLRDLARDPRQLPALIRTGREAGLAFSALGLAAAVLRANGPCALL